MAQLVVWHRSPLWDRPEPPWEDDGCDPFRQAAVAGLDAHPRVRRAFERLLRRLGPSYWLHPKAISSAAEQVRVWHEESLERLRAERLEAEREARIYGARARLEAQPVRRET